MYLVLFDIDGTLLRTGGIGQASAKEALVHVFGTSGRIDRFYPGGRTIEGIFVDTLEDAGFEESVYLAERERLYKVFFSIFQKNMEKDGGQVYPLPGAQALLKSLSARREVMLGVVTGNHQLTANSKLSAAGFDPKTFKVGAYGNESADRADLIPLVQERAEGITGQMFPGRSTVMIGDTTRDVMGAKEAGAQSVAVTTGTDDREMLSSVQPDYILPGLENVQDVLEELIKS